MFGNVLRWLKALYEQLSKKPVIGMFLRAAAKGRADMHKDMAASIAYYTFLSLFPLILGLVSLGGYFLKSTDVQIRVNELLVQILPVSSDLVTRNIDSLIRIRGAAGITSVAVLLWSASRVVGALSRAINKSLGQSRPFAVYWSKLRYFALTLAVAVIVFLAMAFGPFIDILANMELEFLGQRLNRALDIFAGTRLGFAITALLVTVVYFLIPYTRLPWRELLPGIVVATILIEVGKWLFALYVETIANYSTVYGSLSSIIVLLLWFYFSARVVLYGAEIISVTREEREKNDQH